MRDLALGKAYSRMDFSIGFLYQLLKDGLAWLLKRRTSRQASPMERLEARKKWKLDFEAWIKDRRQYHLRPEVIVRDVNRMDDYPETEETKKVYRLGSRLTW